MVDLIIVGASAFARELLQYVQDARTETCDYRVKGFLDDDPEKLGASDNEFAVEVIGDTRSYEIEADDRFLISLGDPRLRRLLSHRLSNRGAQFFTHVHPTAYVARSARIGAGSIVGPFANVGSYAEIDEHVLLNLYSAAGHDTRVGSCSVFSPYSVANGGSTLGQQVFLGSHAVVTPNVRVGDQCQIAAGSVVYRDIPEQSLATGNPAKAFPLSSHT